jgi:hypothetical protein
LDSSWDIVWSKAYGKENQDEIFNSVIVLSNGYLFAGFTGSTSSDEEKDLWIVRTSSDGSIVWQCSYGQNGIDSQEVATSCIEVIDGYIIGGYIADPYDTTRSWVFKVSKSDGSVIWQKKYYQFIADSAKIHDLQTINNGADIIAAGTDGFDYCLYKIDPSNGNLTWPSGHVYYYTSMSLNFAQCHAFDITDSDGYILAGFASIGSNFEFWIITIDAGGAPLWGYTYGGTQNDRSYAVINTGDGGYIVAGDTYSATPSISKYWILSIGGDGDCGDLDQAFTFSRSSTSVNTVTTTISAGDTSEHAQATTVTPTAIYISEDNL